ncbi:hypothetical protein [[Phormidium] sp. ETS-05]|uniref:hypothetical protein n=1 Tax=[Phormidium] sp. ETS-05 TaxID=222819 RepID=UPI0018EEE46B|nr:hypothetical protein [[Phormidium] sp. ETS-05]
MSENVSTKSAVEELSPQTTGNKTPLSVETYADRLMNELFDDVDRILDGGSRIPARPTHPEVISLQQIQVPQIILPTVVLPPPAPPEVAPSDEASAITTSKTQPNQNKWVDKLLMGGAFVSLVATLGLWLWSRGDLRRVWAQMQELLPNAVVTEPVAPPQVKTPEQLKAEADAKFMRYMEKALEAIERDPDTAAALPTPPGQTAVTPAAPLPLMMAPPPVNVTVNPTVNAAPGPVNSGNVAEALHRIAIALERLSIPGLDPFQIVTVPQAQPPQLGPAQRPQPPAAPKPAPKPAPSPTAQPQPATVAAAPTPRATATPTTTPRATTTPTTTPRATTTPTTTPRATTTPTTTPRATTTPTTTPRATAQPSPTLQATLTPTPTPPPPGAATAEPSPIPTGPAPAPAPTASEEPTPEVTETPTPSSPEVTHVLIGILELGEQSAALFEVNGASRRVKVGENIGSSGWTLVEVKNREAVIRRNGEVRSISVGQSF